jgi:uncharacterized membrane protein YfcA
LLGLAAGILSGLVGIGGGIIIVPALVLLWGFTQQTAQGTSLAMLLLPTGILAVITYYKAGHIDVRFALLLAAGFVFGGLFGAKIATSISTIALKRTFGVVLMLVAIRMIWAK